MSETPDWTEGNTGLSYRNRHVSARIWPMFHGGYAWMVSEGVKVVARGSTSQGSAEARTAANAALAFVETPDTPRPLPTSVGGVS